MNQLRIICEVRMLASLAPTWLNPERVASVIAHLEDADRAKDDLKKCVVSWAKEAGLTQKRVQDFIELVANANKECEHVSTDKPKFPKYMVHSIMLAFMWERAQSKRELFPYYQKLDSIFDAVSKDEKMCLNEWFELKFELDNERKDPINVNDCGDYEIAVHRRVLKRFATEVPPIPKGHDVGPHIKVPDCAESSVRSIVNLIIFDPSRQVFDTSLISVRAKPKQALFKFYNGKNRNGIPRNLASTELTSLETAEAWFEVVSNLQDVAYCRSVIENDKDYYYELEPTDMLQAFARLFGFPLSSVTSYTQLAAQLSNTHVQIKANETNFDYDKEEEQDDYDEVEDEDFDKCVKFTFSYANGHIIRADLMYRRDHACVRYYSFNADKSPPVTLWEVWLSQTNKLNDIAAPLMALSGTQSMLKAFVRKSKVDHISQVAKWHMLNSLPSNQEHTNGNINSKIAFLLKGEIHEELLREVYSILGRLKAGIKVWIKIIIEKRLYELVDLEELFTMHPKLFKAVVQVAVDTKSNDLMKKFLTFAIQSNNTKRVQLLFKEGYTNDYSEANQAESPLHLAVKLGNTKMAQLLLSNGSNVNQCDANQMTPLHYATQNSDLKMIKILLQHGANKTAFNTFGETPLALLNNTSPKLAAVRKLFKDEEVNWNKPFNDDSGSKSIN